MKRIHNLLADIESAYTQGNVGEYESVLMLLIELVKVLAQKVELLETRTKRIEQKQTGISFELRQQTERMEAGESLKPADDE